MSDFLLVHGSCHAAWCWDFVVPQLQALGHRARAIDLPSHGADKTPAHNVTLDLYADAILTALERPTIVVGHSMAGYPITAAAARGPGQIARLIYLCAYVPIEGKSLAQMRRMAPTQPLLDAILVDETRTTFSIDQTKGADRFFHDVDPDRAAWAMARLGPQPILPQETAYSPQHPISIPRRYVLCRDDRTIPPAFQATMTADWDPDHITQMDTSHSPFLADPVGLAAVLSRLAQD